jgi:hypothetical protein
MWLYSEEFLKKITQMNKTILEQKGGSTPRPPGADANASEKKTNLNDELKRAEHINKTKLAVVRGVLLESKMKLKEKREVCQLSHFTNDTNYLLTNQ